MLARVAILTALVAGLPACSGVRIDPPAVPSIADVVAKRDEIQRADISSPPDYVHAGYLLVDEQCQRFFARLANARRDFDFVRRETTLGVAAVSTTLALLKNSAQGLAILAAGGAFVSETIDNTQDFATLTRYTDQLEKIVRERARLYRIANDPSTVDSKSLAIDVVASYARGCTVDQLEIDIAQSLSNSKPTLETNLGAAAPPRDRNMGAPVPGAADFLRAPPRAMGSLTQIPLRPAFQ